MSAASVRANLYKVRVAAAPFCGRDPVTTGSAEAIGAKNHRVEPHTPQISLCWQKTHGRYHLPRGQTSTIAGYSEVIPD
jgi:hypothetical protein